MQTPPKNYYFDEFDGTIYDSIEEARNSVIYNSASEIFCLLKKEDSHYLEDSDRLSELKVDIIEAAKNLITALESPDKFIRTYNLKK